MHEVLVLLVVMIKGKNFCPIAFLEMKITEYSFLDGPNFAYKRHPLSIVYSFNIANMKTLFDFERWI